MKPKGAVAGDVHAAYVDHDVAKKLEGLVARVGGLAVLAVAHLQGGARFGVSVRV